MATNRNPSGKFTRKDTATDTRAEALAQQLHADTESLWQQIGSFFGPFTPARTLVTFVSRITLYAIGCVASFSAIAMLSMAMQLGGWPLFLIAVIEIVAFICALVGSWMLSDAVINYIAAGHVSRDIKRAGSWIKERFDGSSTFIKQRMAMH